MVLGTEGMEGGKKGEGSPAGRGAQCGCCHDDWHSQGNSPVGVAIRSDAKQHMQVTEARVKEEKQNAL